ncbi:MAG: hypothetical protein HZA83_03075 [Thaumarchaeota archaeon]|nr:hypothetical protein [Nitrososphaerota archaeon]
MPAKKTVKKEKKEEKKEKKEQKKEKTKVKVGKVKEIKKEVTVPEEPSKKVDIDTTLYHNLFKFLEDKVSVECFIGLHKQCFGRAGCECECHTKR